MVSENLKKLFSELDQKNIQYVILRGYESVDEIEKGKDIDIYVEKKDKTECENLLHSLGWKKPKINANMYPHVQYYYFGEERIYKLDVVYDIFFGRECYHYSKTDPLLRNRKKSEVGYIPETTEALEMLIYHIAYDKNEISGHNWKRFLCETENYKKRKKTSEFLDEIVCAADQAEYADKTELLKKWKEIIKKYENCCVDGKMKFCDIRKSYVKFKGHVRSLSVRLKRKDMVFVGVDGSGKSTIINKISAELPERTTVQYMGCRDYDNQKISMENGGITNLFRVYVQMWKRYWKNRFQYGKIILFDRWPYEIFINSSGYKRKIYRVLYRCLFPKPKRMVYMYCSETCSFRRKDDITDEQQFCKMKQRFDAFYLNQRNVIGFDTEKKGTEELYREIWKLIKEEYYDILM